MFLLKTINCLVFSLPSISLILLPCPMIIQLCHLLFHLEMVEHLQSSVHSIMHRKAALPALCPLFLSGLSCALCLLPSCTLDSFYLPSAPRLLPILLPCISSARRLLRKGALEVKFFTSCVFENVFPLPHTCSIICLVRAF